MYKTYLLTILLMTTTVLLSAQNYNIATQNGQTINTCSGNFYDSGGGGSSYGNNENNTITFCSNNATNTQVQLYFNQFDIDYTDTLWIHDGPTVADPLIMSGNNLQNFFNNFNSLNLFPVQSTTAGCLTIRFKTDGSSVAAGWDATITCVNVCQSVFAAVDSANTSPAPNDSNYVDACLGDSITFAGKGIYPQNGIVYQQSDITSTFIWDFGDGTLDTGQVVKHLYTIARGFDVMLTVIDSNGCVSTNAINLRVRHGANPIKTVTPPQPFCANTTKKLNADDFPNMTNVYYSLIKSKQSSSQRFDSTMFIPDGPNCPTSCYNTDVTFNNFLPGQTIGAATDILSICVNMEHSFVGDLEFTIICPNNQQATLKTYINSGGAWMGQALDGPPWDNSSFPCDPTMNAAGIGWNYCWSHIYPNIGTINAHSNQNQLDSTNTVLNTNYYQPDQPLSNLIGCPLNGTWTIQICDYWAIDNGYIFSWDLNLDPNLLPTDWGYTVNNDTMIWSGPFIDSTALDHIFISPDIGGNYSYLYTFVDEYGCQWDTVIPVKVVDNPDINLGNDTTLCPKTVITLDAGTINNGTYQWSPGGQASQTITTATPGTYIVSVTNTDYNLTCVSADTIVISNYPAINPGFYLDKYDGCQPLSVQFTNSSSPTPFNSALWKFGDGNTSGDISPLYTYYNPGTYDVGLVITSTEGCKDSIIIPNLITVYSQPIADFDILPSQTVEMGQLISFLDKTVNPAYWQWDFGDGNGSTAQHPVHNYGNPGKYVVTLIVFTDNGCPDTLSKIIEVYDSKITIPNIITPNGDGYNDMFIIDNLLSGAYFERKLVIFNRWGKQVFKTNNYMNDWNAENLSDGVYYFVLECKGYIRNVSTQGTITILRSY
ncbi:MAG: PKD domain-containing protein [Bacteroidales bacterium]|nr:PKD domain-containing protein [Bacteroidales bacterium]